MKRIAIAVLAVAAAFGLSAAVLAETPPEAPKPGSAVGELTKMDGKSLTITTKVADKSTETVVTVNDATKFFQQPITAEPNPATAKLEDLKVGQTVWADYNADKAASLVIMTGKTIKSPRQLKLETLLDEETKGFNLPEGSTLADWMKTIKDSYPEFSYFIDADRQIKNNLDQPLPDAQLPDLSAVVANRTITIRQVLKGVLESAKVTDPRNSPPDKALSPTFVITSDYLFISSPGGCRDYTLDSESALLANAALALASRKAFKTPKALALNAALDQDTKGFNLPEGSTLADWMKTIKDSYPAFRYSIDADPQINKGEPTLADVQIPDLSAIVFKGKFTIRHVLRVVLDSMKIVDPRNIPPGKAMAPTFIVTDDSIFISSPGGCREKIAQSAK